jgi:transketolase
MATTDQLNTIAKRLRIHSLKMTAASNSGHPTTCMSIAEIMSVLFFDEMAFNTKDPKDPANDEIILSKGHAAPILWAAYAEAGILPENKLLTLRKIDSELEGHPTPRMPWIKAATGSLGQGLSVGVGMALAQRWQKSAARTFVIMGDGELAEGSVWEAVALGAHYKLNNLIAIADINGLGQSGGTLHNHDMQAWGRKFASFGWNTIVVDGHNVESLKKAFAQAKTSATPIAIVAKTFKGHGISFLDGKEGWHGKPVIGADLEKALKELGDAPKVGMMVKTPQKMQAPHLDSTGKLVPTYKLGESVATRQAYGTALAKLGKVNLSVVALDAETKNSTFAQDFMKTYPERFVECFIAEQNMVGVAIGLSAKGYTPFCSTFAAFFTRAHDFIRMAAYSEAHINIVGSHVGVSIGADGASQMGLEDLGMMRPLPHATVLYPSDAVSTERLTQALCEHKGIGYLRTTREKTPVLYENDDEFPIGGCKVLREDNKDQITILAAGITLHEALKAHAELLKHNMHARIVDVYSVKPLDAETIRSCVLTTSGKVLVVEDHYAEGGIGEAVAIALAGEPMTFSHLCVRDLPRSGEPDELMALFGIDAAAIIKEVKRMLK